MSVYSFSGAGILLACFALYGECHSEDKMPQLNGLWQVEMPRCLDGGRSVAIGDLFWKFDENDCHSYEVLTENGKTRKEAGRKNLYRVAGQGKVRQFDLTPVLGRAHEKDPFNVSLKGLLTWSGEKITIYMTMDSTLKRPESIPERCAGRHEKFTLIRVKNDSFEAKSTDVKNRQ